MAIPEKNKNKIEYFFEKNRYIDFLINTKTYKDIYCSKEAAISLVLALISTGILFKVVSESPTKTTSDILINLLGILIGAVVGLLGFVIGGLALIVGSIGRKMIMIISESEQFTELLSIVFRFYFIGSILGMATITHLITYIVLLLPYKFNLMFVLIFLFFNSYIFFFSLLSSIMLMGTCIRLMLLQYKFE